MAFHTDRRGMLRAGSTLGMAGLAGCGWADDEGTPSTHQQAEGTGRTRIDQPTETATARGTNDETLDGVVLPATFVVTKHGDSVVATEGTTGRVAFRGEDDDGAVLQRTFDALEGRGGRVFVKRGRYELARQVDVRSDHTEVISDFAHLRFHDHGRYGGPPEEQVDLNIKGSHVLLRGLVVDGNKENRSTATRTLNLSSASQVTVRDCVVRGGKSVEGIGRGYGINPYHTNHLVVDNCLLADNDRHGIHPGSSRGPFGNVRVTNCTFLNNASASDPTGAAIDIRDHTRSALVANNYFRGNGFGVVVKGERVGTVSIVDNVFVDNRMGEDDSAQVHVRTEDVQSVTVAGNDFRLSDGTIDRPSFQVLVTPNGQTRAIVVRENRFDGSAVALLTEDESRSIRWLIVEDNHFERCRREFVDIERAERVIVRGNRFDQPADGETAVTAIDRTQRTLVADNVLVNTRLDLPSDATTARNVEW